MNVFCNFNLIQIKYKINYIKIQTHCFHIFVHTIGSFIFLQFFMESMQNFYISSLINFMRMKQLFTYVNKLKKKH